MNNQAPAPASPAPAFSRATADAAWRLRLRLRLDEQDAAGLLRRSVTPVPGLVNLSSNDYLALRADPRLAEGAARAARAFGAGAGASRVAGGTSELHARVERRFAAFKGAEAALALPSGYAANVAALAALAQPGDLILADKLCHASLIDGALLASRARIARPGEPPVAFRTFAHRDAARARALAREHIERSPGATIWLVTDAVFSMDGDTADLSALAALRDELAGVAAGGACLIVDEAHATGVLGATGAGLDEACGRVADISVSTASKALGAQGGFITGPAEVIAAVENFARPFVFSTGVAPPLLGAIDAALDVLRDEPERRARLTTLIGVVRAGLRDRGWDVRDASTDATPIIPLIVGDTDGAIALSARLRDAGIAAPAIRPPTVAPGTARVRLSLHSAITSEEAEAILHACAR